MPAFSEGNDPSAFSNLSQNLDDDDLPESSYFLLHKSSVYLLNGEPNPDAFSDNFKALWIAVPALLIGLPVFANAFFSLADLPQFLFFLVIGLFLLWMAYVTITRFVRASMLQKNGKCLDGVITSLKGIHPGGTGSLVSGRSYELHLRYKFTAPSGEVLHGKGVAIRNDLNGQPLPTEGTSVAILYLNDHFHMVL